MSGRQGYKGQGLAVFGLKGAVRSQNPIGLYALVAMLHCIIMLIMNNILRRYPVVSYHIYQSFSIWLQKNAFVYLAFYYSSGYSMAIKWLLNGY